MRVFEMLITDYLRSKPDLTWDVALQCGVRHAVIRLPEDDGFDPADPEHLKTVLERFENRGIVPVIVEPLPNSLHDHIKLGDGKRGLVRKIHNTRFNRQGGKCIIDPTASIDKLLPAPRVHAGRAERADE